MSTLVNEVGWGVAQLGEHLTLVVMGMCLNPGAGKD
jgi:hypothetical protein